MQHIRRRGDKFQARIYIDGQAKAKTFSTENEAKKWVQVHQLTQLVTEPDDKLTLGQITFADIIESYLEAYEKRREVNRTKAWHLEKLKDEIGSWKLSTVTESRVLRYLANYAEDRAPSSVFHRYNEFNQVGKRASRRLKLSPDLPQRVYATLADDGLIGSSEERDRRPTKDELDRLTEHFNTTKQFLPMADLMWFSIYSCVRLGELVKLRRSDLNEEDREILVRDRKDAKKGVKKSASALTYDTAIPLLGDALSIIERQTVDPAQPDLIFPHSTKTISNTFARICKKLEIEDLRWHDLRREGTSRLFENGWGIADVASVTGHRNWKVLQRYTRLSAKHLHRLPYQ